MAMNKKEQAAFDAAILQAKIVVALRWTDFVSMDVAIPIGNNMTTGYYFNSYNLEVSQYYSFSFSHGRGEHSARATGSQNGKALFSTKLLALKAMRHAVELESANKLLSIDLKIDAELNKQ